MILSPLCRWLRSGPALWVCALLAGAGLPAAAQFPDAPRDPLPPLPARRAAVLKEFDQDHDGRLDAREREAARKAWATRKLAERGDRGFFQPPPELIAEFDKNKDGELDDEEGRTAMETMGRRFDQMRKDYDLDKNGRLDEAEIAAAVKDVDAGKLKGIPRMFVQFAAGPPGRRGGRPGGPPAAEDTGDPGDELRAADRDGDGRLSAAEQESVRAAWARRRAASPAESKTPGGNRP